ncbi:MAG: hypothetical protein VX699_11055 [Myxococcota bacterium]|nr:hypothetical protein [Myxococcota bacterium]
MAATLKRVSIVSAASALVVFETLIGVLSTLPQDDQSQSPLLP